MQPKTAINKKTATALILLITITAALLIQTLTLNNANNQLSAELQKTTQTNQELKSTLQSLTENYTLLESQIKAAETPLPPPPIETRLGMNPQQATYVDKIMLWVTGEVQNMGNRTLYNVRLRFHLNTDSWDSETVDHTIGILEPNETVTIKTSIASRLSADITSWKLTTTATYTP